MINTILFYAPLVLYFIVLCALLFSQLRSPRKDARSQTLRSRHKYHANKTAIPDFRNTMHSEACSEITEDIQSASDAQQLDSDKEDEAKKVE